MRLGFVNMKIMQSDLENIESLDSISAKIMK
jgi:hypothetical protein